MIRILHCVNQMNRAGLETMLMNTFRALDREQISFDFLTHRSEPGDYDEEIRALGGRIYRMPRLYPWNYPAYFRAMDGFFREHPEYTVVHSHIDAMSFLPLLAARRAGIPIRIAHSHSTGIDLDYKYPLKQMYRLLLPTVATHRVACCDAAGAFLFGKQLFQVIPNGIRADAFCFTPEGRQKLRREWNLEDKLVVGHVGRLSYAKNQEFLLRVFQKVLGKTDSVLLLVGTGEREAFLKNLAKRLGVGDSVRFLGSRADVAALYSAMDVFVMPSRFEGLPLAAVEAQMAGLPCILSEGIPRQAAYSRGCTFLPLTAGAAVWSEAILAGGGQRFPVTDCPWDSRRTVAALTALYAPAHREKECL